MSETNDPFEWEGRKDVFKKYLMERSRSPSDLPDAKHRAVMACLMIPEPIQKWMVESGAAEQHIASIAETIRAAEQAKDAEITKLTSQLDEARAKAIEECIAHISAFTWPHQMDTGPYAKGFFDGQNSTVKCISDDLRALLHGSTK